VPEFIHWGEIRLWGEGRGTGGPAIPCLHQTVNKRHLHAGRFHEIEGEQGAFSTLGDIAWLSPPLRPRVAGVEVELSFRGHKVPGEAIPIAPCDLASQEQESTYLPMERMGQSHGESAVLPLLTVALHSRSFRTILQSETVKSSTCHALAPEEP